MRIRTFPLALMTALAACQGSPTVPDPSLNSAVPGSGYRSESDASTLTTPYVGSTGSRDGGADASAFGSPAIGTGLRDGGDSASATSGFMSGGYRVGEPETASSIYMGGGNREGDATASSAYAGGGTRVGGDDAAETASSGYVGGGFRVDEAEKDSPLLGGGGGR